MDVDVVVEDHIAHINLKQVYLNPRKDQPQDDRNDADREIGEAININFKFPKVKNTIISRMTIKVDNQIIEALIEQNEAGK